MRKIWKYFEKGQPHGSDYCMHETARICHGCENGWVCSWKKSSLVVLGLPFILKLDWYSYIVFIDKTASTTFGAFARSVKLLFPKVAPYLYKSIKQPWTEYYCYARAGAPSCYLDILDTIQKWAFRTVTCCLSWALGLWSKCIQLKFFL